MKQKSTWGHSQIAQFIGKSWQHRSAMKFHLPSKGHHSFWTQHEMVPQSLLQRPQQMRTLKVFYRRDRASHETFRLATVGRLGEVLWDAQRRWYDHELHREIWFVHTVLMIRKILGLWFGTCYSGILDSGIRDRVYRRAAVKSQDNESMANQ